MPTQAPPRGPIPPGQLANVPWTAQQYAVQELARRRRIAEKIRESARARRAAETEVVHATYQLAEAILETLPRDHPTVIRARCAELERDLPPSVSAAIRRGGAR